jgi:hypothetical protein
MVLADRVTVAASKCPSAVALIERAGARFSPRISSQLDETEQSRAGRGRPVPSLLPFVQPGRDSRARSGACSVYESDSAGPLADRRESDDRQAPRGSTVGAGVVPAFTPKRNGGDRQRSPDCRRRGASRDWRLARAARRDTATPALPSARASALGEPVSCKGIPHRACARTVGSPRALVAACLQCCGAAPSATAPRPCSSRWCPTSRTPARPPLPAVPGRAGPAGRVAVRATQLRPPTSLHAPSSGRALD